MSKSEITEPFPEDLTLWKNPKRATNEFVPLETKDPALPVSQEYIKTPAILMFPPTI